MYFVSKGIDGKQLRKLDWLEQDLAGCLDYHGRGSNPEIAWKRHLSVCLACDGNVIGFDSPSCGRWFLIGLL